MLHKEWHDCIQRHTETKKRKNMDRITTGKVNVNLMFTFEWKTPEMYLCFFNEILWVQIQRMQY